MPGVFSFYGNKTITTGEGGMVVTSNGELADHVRFLKNHAMSAEKRYYHPELGFNFRMTNMQAAIGLAQLAAASDLVARKRHIHARYRAALSQAAGIHLQTVPAGHFHAPWLTAIVDDAFGGEADRDALIVRIAKRGVDLASILLSQPHDAGVCHERGAGGTLPVTESISFRGLALPSGAGLTDSRDRPLYRRLLGGTQTACLTRGKRATVPASRSSSSTGTDEMILRFVSGR